MKNNTQVWTELEKFPLNFYLACNFLWCVCIQVEEMKVLNRLDHDGVQIVSNNNTFEPG
jgi:hypothetical protein